MLDSGLHVVRHHPHALGPPVVLVHGAPDRSKSFAHVVHRLGDLAVTVYDRRGYGRSTQAARQADGTFLGGFEVHARDLIDLLDGTPSVVCGQSAGGTIAMLAATQAPELFAALGVWEPPLVAWDWWVGAGALEQLMAWARYEDPGQLAEDMNRTMLGEQRWDQLRDSTRQMLRDEGAAFRADMGQLAVPFLVGCGTVSPDPAVLAAHRRTAARTGAELFVGEGADHVAHTSTPDVWVELVRRTVDLTAAAAAALTDPGARARAACA